MGKKGGTYYSAERLAKIVAQAKAAGRRELVDELRERYTQQTAREMELLGAYCRGLITGGCRDANVHRALLHIDTVIVLMLAIDQEVINEPGF